MYVETEPTGRLSRGLMGLAEHVARTAQWGIQQGQKNESKETLEKMIAVDQAGEMKGLEQYWEGKFANMRIFLRPSAGPANGLEGRGEREPAPVFCRGPSRRRLKEKQIGSKWWGG